MIRSTMSLLCLLAVVCSLAVGCSKTDKEIKFNAIPEGTPSVNTGGGAPKGGGDGAVPPKVIRKIQD